MDDFDTGTLTVWAWLKTGNHRAKRVQLFRAWGVTKQNAANRVKEWSELNPNLAHLNIEVSWVKDPENIPWPKGYDKVKAA
jgi:hypothetical protein